MSTCELRRRFSRGNSAAEQRSEAGLVAVGPNARAFTAPWAARQYPLRYDLTERVVLITGASGGIGRACAVEFHRAGARVVAVARTVERLESLAKSLGNQRILAIPADVTVDDERDRALNAARERFGTIDVLVNNAGWASFGTLQRLPREHLERMLRLNVMAPVELIQRVLPDMVSRRSGQIIMISSVVGSQAIPRMTMYSATKHALNGLTSGLRMELRGTGVDVVLVAPSSTRTSFFDSAGIVDAKATRLASTQYPPERVARAVVNASLRRKREVTLSFEGNAICAIRRVSHRLADAIMYRVAKGAMPTVPLSGDSAQTWAQPAPGEVIRSK